MKNTGVIIAVALLLSTVVRASAGLLELPIAIADDRIFNFWPRLNASCEKKILQDNLCCLDSTFEDASKAQHLLLQLLQNVPDPKNAALSGESQLLYESNGLQAGARYTCDIPLDSSDGTPRLGCHRCLEEIVKEITSGMSQNGRCENAWALRLAYIYEPDTPWEEDTTWCHLEYWFQVLPSLSTSSDPRNWISCMLTLASSISHRWSWNPLRLMIW